MPNIVNPDTGSHLHLSRREFGAGALKIAAWLTLLKQAWVPKPALARPSSSPEQEQKQDELSQMSEVWERERMSEMLNQLERSYEAFGLTPEAAHRISGTVRFYRQVEAILEKQSKAQPKTLSRRQVLGLGTLKPVIEPAMMMLLKGQFLPLCQGFSTAENNDGLEIQIAGSYEAARRQYGQAHETQVDPTLSPSSRALLKNYLQELDAAIPGAASLVTLIQGYVPRGGEAARANAEKGMIECATNVPLSRMLPPILFTHELGHVHPFEVAERNDVVQLPHPERFAHWDPRLIIQGRTEINNLLAELIDQSAANDISKEMDIHFSHQFWEKECDQTSAAYMKLKTEIGERDANEAAWIIKDNLNSDPRKMKGLIPLLRRYPDSQILQDWVARVLYDLEHFILDRDITYCDYSCPTGNEKSAEDPRVAAAIRRAEITVGSGLPLGTQDLPLRALEHYYRMKSIFTQHLANLLSQARVQAVEDLTSDLGSPLITTQLQCALVIAQIIVDETAPAIFSSQSAATLQEQELLRERLIASIDAIARSSAFTVKSVLTRPTSENQGSAVSDLSEITDDESSKVHERDIIHSLQVMLETTYFRDAPVPQPPTVGRLLNLLEYLKKTSASEPIQESATSLETFLSSVDSMVTLAQKCSFQEETGQLSNGLSMLVALAHRLATPLLLGWDYERRQFHTEGITQIMGKIPEFQDRSKVVGATELPSPALQELLNKVITEEIGEKLGSLFMQAETMIGRMGEGGTDEKDELLGLINQLTGILINAINDYQVEEHTAGEVHNLLGCVDSLRNKLAEVEALSLPDQPAAYRVILQRLQMAMLGWFTSTEIQFSDSQSADFHELYLGASLV